MSENSYCVYKHTSPSGKVYIGITGKNPEDRWGNGRYYRAIPFRNAITKYGWDNISHEILFTGLSRNEANEKEIELIALYDSTNPKRGYNVTRGGNCRFLGENHPLYGKKRSPETIAKVVAKIKGRPWTENQRRASEKYYMTHKAHNYGKTASMETKEKLRQSHLGQCRPHDPETIAKITEANKYMRKPVAQYSLSGEILTTYDSVTAAGKAIGEGKVPKENIRQCCHGRKKTAYGYIWRFIEEV